MRAIAKSRAAFELYPDEYPLLVRFRDIADPASVEEIDPANLAANFGPGISLKLITITVTDDAVTSGIRNLLPWLSSAERNSDRRLKNPSRPFLDRSLPVTIRHGDFVKD